MLMEKASPTLTVCEIIRLRKSSDLFLLAWFLRAWCHFLSTGHGPSKGPALASMSPNLWEILRNEKAESPELPRGPKSVLQLELTTKWTVTLIIIGIELSWLWG